MNGEIIHNLCTTLHNTCNQRQTNLLISWLILVVSFYVAFIAVLDLDIFHPFTVPLNATTRVELIGESLQSTMSLFFLVIIGVFVGKLFFFAKLPPLFGMLLVGIAIRNIPGINTLFNVNSYWSTCARKAALAVILLRLGVGLDTAVLKKRPILPLSIGIGSILCEAATITVTSHFIFGLSTGISVINGVLLAATSPAVVVPAFLDLQNRGLGTEKGIPTLILAGAGLDNVFAITAFSVAVGIVFSTASLASTIIRYIVQLLASAIVGVAIGLLLWIFPKREMDQIHIWRVAMLASISAAITFGCMTIKADAGGIIALLLAAGVAAIRWKKDNPKKVKHIFESVRIQTQLESHTFGFAWNIFFQPLLFTLVGMEFRFSILSWYTVGVGVAILFIGCAVRTISLHVLTFGSGFNVKERILISFSFFSKATVQAALVTTVLSSAQGLRTIEDEAKIVLVANVLAIIITSPLGLILIQIFGPRLLKPKVPSRKPSKTEPEAVITEDGDIEVEEPTKGTPPTEEKYISIASV